MRTDPFSDAFAFLIGATDGHASIGRGNIYWGSAPFILLSTGLVAGSIVLAVVNWFADPAQRSGRNVAVWLMRTLVGGMWLEGSLWKLPLPVSDGFKFWLGLTGDNAAFAAYGTFVKSVLIANIAVINPLIFLTEVTLAVCLMLGVAVRLGALLGVAMALNLWIGLYHFMPEWPWSYVFLGFLHVFFSLDRAGRALGLDALLLRRNPAWFAMRPWLKQAC